ncbi:hypothetical protein [Streptomyces milbemycinicus]|uniref:hypothetical protein n=1 Tax=Streptomyces milbemycinicus TaxID=476552 RepID=UPI0033FDAED2
MLVTAVHRFAGQQGDHLLVTASNSVDTKGEKPQFSWNEADVLNWSTKKPYDF